MRILFAGDEHPYSAQALKKVIELARHTWADVTLLSVLPAQPSSQGESLLPAQDPRVQALCVATGRNSRKFWEVPIPRTPWSDGTMNGYRLETEAGKRSKSAEG